MKIILEVELDVLQEGVVSSSRVGKGKGVTDAPYVTTTEASRADCKLIAAMHLDILESFNIWFS